MSTDPVSIQLPWPLVAGREEWEVFVQCHVEAGCRCSLVPYVDPDRRPDALCGRTAVVLANLFVSALLDHVTTCGEHMSGEERARVSDMVLDGIRAVSFVESEAAVRDVGLRGVLSRLGCEQPDFEWMLIAAMRPRDGTTMQYAAFLYGASEGNGTPPRGVGESHVRLDGGWQRVLDAEAQQQVRSGTAKTEGGREARAV